MQGDTFANCSLPLDRDPESAAEPQTDPSGGSGADGRQLGEAANGGVR